MSTVASEPESSAIRVAKDLEKYIGRPSIHFETFRNVLRRKSLMFYIFGYDSKQRVWRKTNTARMAIQNLLLTVKRGGGFVILWACMSPAGAENLIFIDTEMDCYVFLNLLKVNLRLSQLMD